MARLVLLLLATLSVMQAEVYELRTYTTHPGKLDALHARFKNHTIKLFEKHGMKNLMYWVPQDEPRKSNTLIYVVKHKSRQAAEASWKAFREDPEWTRVKGESEAPGPIVQKVETVFMDLAPYSPAK